MKTKTKSVLLLFFVHTFFLALILLYCKHLFHLTTTITTTTTTTTTGGHLQQSITDNVITANGEHGHLYMYYQSAKSNRNGGIMVCVNVVCCLFVFCKILLTNCFHIKSSAWFGIKRMG